MKSAFPFHEQLSDWLLSMDFQCVTASPAAGYFPVLQVGKEQKTSLTLVLIDLHTWQQTDAPSHWNECIQYVTDARDNGNNCIVLWEDFWIRKQEIVKSRLLAFFGQTQKIPGRLTIAKRIDKAAANTFLEQNHLNGSVSSKYKYGLFLPVRYFRVLNETSKPQNSEPLLVAVATFSFPRIFNKDTQPFRSHELIRFASLLHTNVVGGLDKLLQAFVRDKEPGDIMTYADLEWSAGKSYEKLGFEERSRTGPEAFYLDPTSMERGRDAEASQSIYIRNMGSIKFVKTLIYTSANINGN